MLAPEIQDALSALARGAQSVRAVTAMTHSSSPSPSDNRFTRALEALQRLAVQQNIPLAIVGGLGAIRYGYPAVTEDIAVGDQQLDTLIRVAPEFGFKVTRQAESGWHTLEHGDVEINIVPEGRKARNDSPTSPRCTQPTPPSWRNSSKKPIKKNNKKTNAGNKRPAT